MENISALRSISLARFLSVAFCFFFVSSSWPQSLGGAVTKRALIIGNGAYQHLPSLKTPIANTTALADVMKALGVKVTLKTDLGIADLSQELNAFAETIGPGDIVLLYFSGYGIQAKAGNAAEEQRENWLVPTGFDPASPRRISQQAYAISRVTELWNDRKAGPKLVVIDANRLCSELDSRATDIGLMAEDPRTEDTLIAYAAAPEQLAVDPPDNGVNLFTSNLISALGEPGLTAIQIFNHVQNRVRSQSGEKQTPYFNSIAIKDFYFVDPPKVVESKPEIKPGEIRVNRKDSLQYAWVPAGSFEMGCVPVDGDCANDERPRHHVKISRGFWLTNTEVTVSAYELFTRVTGHPGPSKTKTNPKWKLSELPVTKVGWNDAEDYCKWTGGRLPTEAEWEYAARAGKPDQVYPWGNEFNADFCNSVRSGKGRGAYTETAPVRLFDMPNGWTLFGMIGNAREWVSDTYVANGYTTAGASTTDPQVSEPGKQRVLRGGSFGDGEKQLRTSARDHLEPQRLDNQTGFRCVVSELQ
jgi:formylglycine-generating enzyme required for sulfatase activity